MLRYTLDILLALLLDDACYFTSAVREGSLDCLTSLISGACVQRVILITAHTGGSQMGSKNILS